MPLPRILNVYVRDDYCAAHGCCVLECPEVFKLEGGWASLTADAGKYFESRAVQILAAYDCCPVSAIVVETEPPLPQPPPIVSRPEDAGKSVLQLLQEARLRAEQEDSRPPENSS